MAKKKKPAVAPLVRHFKHIIRGYFGMLDSPPIESPLPKLQRLLKLAQDAVGRLRIAFPDIESVSPLRLPDTAGRQAAHDSAWVALVRLRDHLRDEWKYTDGNVSEARPEVGCYLNSRRRDLGSDDGGKGFQTEILQEQFDLAFNLIGSSSLILYDRLYSLRRGKSGNENPPGGQLIHDLKHGAARLKAVVRKFQVELVSAKYHWDTDAGTLRVGDATVQLFPPGKKRAPEQEDILNKFQASGWPVELEVSGVSHMNVHRLNQRIKQLMAVPLVLHLTGGGNAIRLGER